MEGLRIINILISIATIVLIFRYYGEEYGSLQVLDSIIALTMIAFVIDCIRHEVISIVLDAFLVIYWTRQRSNPDIG